MKNKDITIIGTGKVAQQLGKQLLKTGNNIVAVWGRTVEKAEKLARQLNSTRLTDLKVIQSDCIAIICVSDGAIAEVIQQIPVSIKIAYTSGSIGLKDLPKYENLGVFYPLQTFSEGSNVDISEVPFLIESENKAFEQELKELAETISKNVLIANSKDRYNTHIAAVMVNNFSNFLYYLAEQHLEEHQLDFEILKPLIKETVRKLELFSPLDAQTGPAVRGDQTVINKHIGSISNPKTKELYSLFSEMIIDAKQGNK